MCSKRAPNLPCKINTTANSQTSPKQSGMGTTKAKAKAKGVPDKHFDNGASEIVLYLLEVCT